MKSLSLCQSIYYNSNIFHSISPNGFSAAITLHMPISTSILYINALHRNIVVFSCMLCIILYTHQQQTLCSTATKCIFVHILLPRHTNNLMQLKIFWQCSLQSVFPPPRYLKLWKISWKCPSFFLYVYHFQRWKCILIYRNTKSLIYYHLICTDCFLTSELKTILEFYFCLYLFHIYN